MIKATHIFEMKNIIIDLIIMPFKKTGQDFSHNPIQCLM